MCTSRLFDTSLKTLPVICLLVAIRYRPNPSNPGSLHLYPNIFPANRYRFAGKMFGYKCRDPGLEGLGRYLIATSRQITGSVFKLVSKSLEVHILHRQYGFYNYRGWSAEKSV